MPSKFRVVLLVIIMFFPSKVKIWMYNRFFGSSIHPTAIIGFSYINVRNFKMGESSYIGHLNLIYNLENLEISNNSSISNLNRILSVPLDKQSIFKGCPNRKPALKLGEHSCIVSRNFFDCSDLIEIGSFTTISGLGISFFTHSIDIKLNKQDTKPISIGSYCMIGAGSIITKGASLPDFSVLGANSTLQKNYKESYFLYSGVPAIPVKKIDMKSAYFHRKIGKVE